MSNCTSCKGERGKYLGTLECDGSPACWVPCWECDETGLAYEQQKYLTKYPDSLKFSLKNEKEDDK